MTPLAKQANVTASHYDVLIVGGGVIGLSLAWELARHDAKVCVVERGELGREASWAGAGMVPPGPAESQWADATPVEKLAGLSQQLHAQWHQQLLEQTGIDNEYRLCGALQLATTSDERQRLDEAVSRWQQLGIACQPLDDETLSDIEPSLAAQSKDFMRAYHLPDEAQLRNPRHLRALVAACQRTGVDLRPGVELHRLESSGNGIQRAVTSEGNFVARHFCLAAGSWTGLVATGLGLELPVRPIRGQIVLLDGPPGLVRRNINVGPRYLVPRRDGRLLVGSTQEDVGYLKANTAAGTSDLLNFAQSIAPQLGQLPIVSRWSGLRPDTPDGLPYLGRLPAIENGWLATGHFRAGLQLSPATAVVLRELLLGQESTIELSTFGVNRT